MNILTYLKYQYKTLFILLLCFPIPLYFFLKFSPYHVDGVQYFFLVFLLILKFSFFNNQEYKKEIEDAAKSKLSKKIKRTPSKSEIVMEVNHYANARDAVIGFNALLIIFLGTFKELI